MKAKIMAGVAATLVAVSLAGCSVADNFDSDMSKVTYKLGYTVPGQPYGNSEYQVLAHKASSMFCSAISGGLSEAKLRKIILDNATTDYRATQFSLAVLKYSVKDKMCE